MNKTLCFVIGEDTSMALIVFIFPLTNLKVERKNMKVKKTSNKFNKSENEKLVRLLALLSPEDHQLFLNQVDETICYVFSLDQKDLPWINPNKHEDNWKNFMMSVRLGVMKITYEYMKKERTVH